MSNTNFLCLLIILPLIFPQYFHHPTILNATIIQEVAENTDVNRMWQYDLLPILIERYPESPGSWAVRQVRLDSLKIHQCRIKSPTVFQPSNLYSRELSSSLKSISPTNSSYNIRWLKLQESFILCSEDW